MNEYHVECEATDLRTRQDITYTTTLHGRTFEDAKRDHCIKELENDYMTGRITLTRSVNAR